MSAYYNENDKFAASWLRELIKAGLISNGEVDERSIEDVKPSELVGYKQCHFFAGIGGWSYALRLAGWPDDREVWTGSCPCQPFSAAGKRGGITDERHLWPAFFHLIQSSNPNVVFGEQVASKDGLAWFDTVSFDLEAKGYSIGAEDLCAAGVGAPHIRQRLYFVADRYNEGLEGRRRAKECAFELPIGARGLASGYWQDCEWIACRDGKARPIEPGTFPLANGVPNRVGRLRGYGNAVVPQVAEAFIRSFLELETK